MGRNDAGECLRRRIPTALTLTLTVAGLLGLSSAVAQAEAPKLISFGNFGSVAPTAVGVAVDQSSGDVYVTGLLDERNPNLTSSIDKFDASGKPLSPPSPFGEGFDSAAAVNPTNSDVYVLQAGFLGPTAIDTFDPSSGALLSSFPVPESRNYSGVFTAVQIATDSAGNVYVPNVPGNDVEEYSPRGGAPLQTFKGSGGQALSEPAGVAVDSSGNVWVADATGKGRIEEFSPAGAVIGEIKSEGVQALELDTHGDVFAIVENSADFCGSLPPPCKHLVEYSPAGAQLADIGAGSIGAAVGNVPSMLAVNESSGRVYVTDGLKNLVWIYGPPSPPVLGRELAAEVGASEAKLGALINPGGLETSYRFEYDTREYKQGEGPHGISVPFPEGSVGQGVTSRTVWASANGLAPGTTYHFRVIASNELAPVSGVVGIDHTFTTDTSAQGSCPNEQFRTGFSAGLPDCRAYELVTPPTKASTQPDPFGNRLLKENLAARDGNRMAYAAIDILPVSGAQTGGQTYLATRGANGWSSEDVIPLQSDTGLECPGGTQVAGAAKVLGYSADLSLGVLNDGANEGAEGCGAEVVEVVSGEPQGYENLLLRDNTTGAYHLINVPPPGVTPADAHFKGASSDVSHVAFSEHASLTANAPAGVEDLYEWTGGMLRLVTILPNGATVAGSLAGENTQAAARAVSADGSRIFFTAGGNLYVRVNGASTVQIDASQAGGSGGGGWFVDASTDGSRVFFTDDASVALTSDTVPGSGSNLYEYDLGTGRLTDLTPAAKAEVTSVSGSSEDGSFVYFVAGGVLTGPQTNEHGETAQGGQPNVYLSHGGATTFIATRSNQDTGAARVSPNGAFLAFVSSRSLTGYENGTPCETETGLDGALSRSPLCPEIYLYGATSSQLVCASCNPSGEAPTNGATLEPSSPSGSPHYLSDSGRLFFDTAEALVPSDTNHQTDVYEYEGGQLHLISTGTSSSESRFVDASEGGEGVFFLTHQKLVLQDTDEEARNIYDARIGGGFPASSSPAPCPTADACRSASAPQPSIFGAPASATFSGAGNVVAGPAAPAVKPKSAAQLRAEMLAKALRACRSRWKAKAKRKSCEAHAKKRYGPARRAKKTNRRAK
jgi:hypothetical protein